MQLKRQRVQFGWLDLKPRKRGMPVWVLRYRETGADGRRKTRSVQIGTRAAYRTRSEARQASMSLLLSINADQLEQVPITFGSLIERYLAEEIPERHSTASRYQSWIKHHIKPKWSNYPLEEIKPLAVEQWLKETTLAPKSKGHIKNLMRILFNCAMRWGLLPYQQNPMALVRVRNASKRMREPVVLTVSQFREVLEHVPEPYRTMCVVAACLGLRISEVLGLQWRDIEWQNNQVQVRRAWVYGFVTEPKTHTSKKPVPLHPSLQRVLLEHRSKLPLQLQSSEWVFPSRRTGKPSHPWSAQRRWLLRAGAIVGVGRIGWHTFRHTYSTLLNEHGTDVKVQQELLRHADIRTTMNVYTRAVPERLREANSKIVSILLPTGTA
jgi:integrase